MIQFIQSIITYFAERKDAKYLFSHIHAFVKYDKAIDNYKRAIYWGRLYFERSQYDNDGMMDMAERIRRVDAILKEYYQPTDRKEYITLLQKLKEGMVNADKQGLIVANGDSSEYKKVESEYYNKAILTLDNLIRYTDTYPILWSKCFLI